MRLCARPPGLGLAPGAARHSGKVNRNEGAMPRGCPDVEPDPNEPTVRRGAVCLEGPTWGTREFLRRRAKPGSRAVLAAAAPALTLISCLVQPGCCNRKSKARGVAKRQGIRRSD